jgi:hypothetical protein
MVFAVNQASEDQALSDQSPSSVDGTLHRDMQHVITSYRSVRSAYELTSAYDFTNTRRVGSTSNVDHKMKRPRHGKDEVEINDRSSVLRTYGAMKPDDRKPTAHQDTGHYQIKIPQRGVLMFVRKKRRRRREESEGRKDFVSPIFPLRSRQNSGTIWSREHDLWIRKHAMVIGYAGAVLWGTIYLRMTAEGVPGSVPNRRRRHCCGLPQASPRLLLPPERPLNQDVRSESYPAVAAPP